jgi:hypothetical protein
MEITKITTPRGQQTQIERKNNIDTIFNEAVIFVREQALKNAMAREWRDIYNHVINTHGHFNFNN